MRRAEFLRTQKGELSEHHHSFLSASWWHLQCDQLPSSFSSCLAFSMIIYCIPSYCEPKWTPLSFPKLLLFTLVSIATTPRNLSLLAPCDFHSILRNCKSPLFRFHIFKKKWILLYFFLYLASSIHTFIFQIHEYFLKWQDSFFSSLNVALGTLSLSTHPLMDF